MNGSGFIDAHVHIADAAGLTDVAAAGVAAVRDAGLRDNVNRDMITLRAQRGLPKVVSSGWALFKKGGYGSLFGVPIERPDQIGPEIAKLKRAGAGIIKVVASGAVSLKQPGTVTSGGFSCEELLAIVEQARNRGLEVMAHANGEKAIIACARAGVRSIEHGFFMSRAALDCMAEKKIYWTPTVGALARASRSSRAGKEAAVYFIGVIRGHLEMIRTAHGMGVPLAVGTDCILPGPRYEEAYRAELSYFGQAGIPEDDILEIATRSGARLLGLE